MYDTSVLLICVFKCLYTMYKVSFCEEYTHNIGLDKLLKSSIQISKPLNRLERKKERKKERQTKKERKKNKKERKKERKKKQQASA